jgi:phosphate transport system substrate-binding protein
MSGTSRWIAVLVSAAILGLAIAACGGGGSDETSGETSGGGGSSSSELSGEIAGAGSSAQQAAQEAWIATFEGENSGVTISYDPIGSGGGREQFIAGGTAYGGTDAALSTEEGEIEGAEKRCEPGELIEIPDYISPIAVIYNLPGVEELKLEPETLAKIFNQEITSWDDPAIKKSNPEAELPSTRITPVNRSDDSGTTENFVDYLSKVAPSVWSYEVSGEWPVKGGEAGAGTSGVVEAVTAGEGAIGYADASQAGELGVALVQVGSEYVGPTAEAAAKILEESPVDKEESKGQYMFAFELDRKTEAEGTYPIVLTSYLMACTQYGSPEEAELVKSYVEFIISPEGQEVAAENAGSAPMSDSLRSEITPAVEAIEAG